MLEIQYSELAEQDLYSIFKIISEDKPSIAVEYIDKLEATIELLYI